MNTEPHARYSGGQDGLDLVDSPGEVVGRDHEGRGEADDGVVGLLAEEAAIFERFAEAAGGGIELDAKPEALATNLRDMRAADGLQTVERVGTELGGPGGEVLVDKHFERGTSNGAGERVASVGAAVVAGIEDTHDGAGGEHGRDGVHAPGECLADDADVGVDSVVLEGEEASGAAQAGLDLVTDKQDVVLAADGRDFGKVAGGGTMMPASP